MGKCKSLLPIKINIAYITFQSPSIILRPSTERFQVKFHSAQNVLNGSLVSQWKNLTSVTPTPKHLYTVTHVHLLNFVTILLVLFLFFSLTRKEFFFHLTAFHNCSLICLCVDSISSSDLVHMISKLGFTQTVKPNCLNSSLCFVCSDQLSSR